MSKIRILIAEDHKLIRETWSYILNSDERFVVVAECADSAEAVEAARELRPDIVLLDINMKPMNGFEATARFVEISPLIRVIGLSFYSEPLFVKKMFMAGAKGYVTKNSGREEMMNAIIAVHQGQEFICDEIRSKSGETVEKTPAAPEYFENLTNKEIQITQCIREGLRSKDIADRLKISIKTVEVHRHNILRKLQVRNSVSLVNLMNATNGYVRYSF